MKYGKMPMPKNEGGSSSDKKVMGDQGKSVNDIVSKSEWHYQSEATSETKFPG